MKPPVPVVLRAPTPADVPFITRSWMNSFRGVGDSTKHVSTAVYDIRQHALIARLWRDTSVTFVMAVNPTDTWFIYGFAVMEATDAGPILHYAYVRKEDRRLGILGVMMEGFEPDPERPWFYTHGTPEWRKLMSNSKRFPSSRFTYDPYLLYERIRLKSKKK